MTRSSGERPVDTERTRTELLEFFVGEPENAPAYGTSRRNGLYMEVPKLEWELLGGDPPPVIDEHVRSAVDLVNAREDCGDFVLPTLLRLLYRYPNSELLSEGLRADIERAALDYIYWFDEPGPQDMFFSTENHQILFHASELLAGQRFPDRTFTNDGRTGEAHRRHAESRVDRWLDWRARFGFSEWHSNVYYDEDLLALAREDDTATDLAPIDPASTVRECWANVETGEAELVVEADRPILADERRLRQLFENLVRNAVEHGGDGVTVTVGDLNDGFFVEDDGVGIPAGRRDSVFEAGYSTSDEGTGFGLRIAKQVAAAHGWEIRATEGPDGGARFEVTGVASVEE